MSQTGWTGGGDGVSGGGGGGGGGGSAVAAEAYVVGDRRLVITGSKVLSVGNFGGLIFTNVLQERLHWAPASGFTPGAGDSMLFVLAAALNVQSFQWTLSSPSAWGIWIMEAKIGGVFVPMTSLVTLGGAISTIIQLDPDKQTGVTELRFTGSGGSVSGVPYVEEARIIATL